MGLKHALLALLEERSGHGYELKSRFETALGPLWPLREAQVYNNLRILEREGLVALEARALPARASDPKPRVPDRKSYAVTETGRLELEHWLETPVRESRKLKDDFYLKLSVLAALDDEERLANLLWQQREVVLQRLRELERTLQEAELDEDAVTAALVEGAILHAEADLAWLERCEERLLTGGEDGA